MAKLLRRQLQLLALLTIALILLATSTILTFFGFCAWHVFSTRPFHQVPLSFNPVPAVGPKPAAMEAVADLSAERLRAVANMEASVTLSLPESSTNLENSVFQISSYLLSSDEECVAHSSSTATLTFRSPAHRAARAIVLFAPMLLGITREYQTVSKSLFRYTATRRKGVLPKLVSVRVKIHTTALQIESADLVLRVRRSGVLAVIVKEGRLSTFAAVTVGVWYCMLFSFGMLLACVSATRRIIGRFVNGVVSFRRLDNAASADGAGGYKGKGSPPRRILMGHGDRLDDSEIGREWASIYGFS